MNNEMTVDGSWYCGEFTVNDTVLADMIMACQFTDCQKFSGTLFRAAAVMSAKQVVISGAGKQF